MAGQRALTLAEAREHLSRGTFNSLAILLFLKAVQNRAALSHEGLFSCVTVSAWHGGLFHHGKLHFGKLGDSIVEESFLYLPLAAEVKFFVAVGAYGDRIGRGVRAAFSQRPDVMCLKIGQTIRRCEGSRLLA